MKRLAMTLILASMAITTSGCAFVVVARSASYAPAPSYCGECRYVPYGRAAYARCGHYDIRIVRNGYYYRPHKHHGHVEYSFVKFSHSGKYVHGEHKDRKARR